MTINELVSNLDINSKIATPHTCPHFWHSFMLTDEIGYVGDDWAMYCMGQEL